MQKKRIVNFFCILLAFGMGAAILEYLDLDFADEETDEIESQLVNWRYHPGDSMRWAQPGFNDGDWQLISPPFLKMLPFSLPRAWFRCRFVLHEKEIDDEVTYGLWLGRVETADEVFLNGTRIGGEGVVANRFVDAPRKSRVYRLPHYLLQRENVLAVRVQSSFPTGGLADKPTLDEYDRLLLRQQKTETKIKHLEAFSLGVVSMMVLFWLMLRSVRPQLHDFYTLTWLVLLLGVVAAFETLLLYDGGWLSPHLYHVYLIVCILSPLPALAFSRRLAPRGRLGRVCLWLVSANVALALFYAVFGSIRTCNAVYMVWCGLLLLAGGLFALVWFDPNIRRRQDVKVFALALMTLAAVVPVDVWLISSGSPLARFPLQAGAIAMIVVLTAGLTVHFTQFHDALRILSRRLLSAQEEERKRMSRDLHDGLGQELLTCKLNLQCLSTMSENHDELRRAIDKSVKDTSKCIDSLRGIVRDFRPVALDEHGLIEALREWAMKINKCGDILVTIESEMNENITNLKLQENLFRIIQEATANAIKHGGAEEINVSFHKEKDMVVMKIIDNGCGFNAENAAKNGGGIGLLVMHERVATFNGRLTVESIPTAGTSITVEVRAG